MSTIAPERQARCRYLKSSGNRCENPVADDDPNAVQLCPSHALRAAQLLAEHGAIKIQFPNAIRGSA
ncbi:hypothetical protein NE235_10615 [Actinoallomurus spadix]|uniref:Uncharacterized protein n=1 Tax=Actinoallomurus spadix TaxID=79912 RepID=A0ABN0WVF2_9ACTN|nr:hypothetical protein [Actinoallomurus spadix]MCO5986554.1 hypothetical protein [Actinoallomurus spadix]